MKSFFQDLASACYIASFISFIIPLIIMEHMMKSHGKVYTYIETPLTVPWDYFRICGEEGKSKFLFWWYVLGCFLGIILGPMLIAIYANL